MKHPDPLAHRATPLVIGIAGGSGSGKTTVAQEILQVSGSIEAR
jgi:uridine kinase